ncbi:hypothetical protein GCM10023144_44770 [Pigmentiphaga soli]|uniref:Cell division protein FtsL n=1 Tax=Pigmentiphaga soli TaxID=1007095 RepID=A0ABP8HQA6_9BURK
MSRLLFILVIALVGCGLSLVSSQYKARSLFAELEQAQGVARDLDVEWRQLQLEQTDHAKHALIDDVARKALKMEPVTPARTIYLSQRADAGGAPRLLPYGAPGTPPAGARPGTPGAQR